MCFDVLSPGPVDHPCNRTTGRPLERAPAARMFGGTQRKCGSDGEPPARGSQLLRDVGPTRRYRAMGSSTQRAKSAGPTLLPHRIVVMRRPANRSGSSKTAATPSAADGSTTSPACS
jgi:hypothetical protein